MSTDVLPDRYHKWWDIYGDAYFDFIHSTKMVISSGTQDGVVAIGTEDPGKRARALVLQRTTPNKTLHSI